MDQILPIHRPHVNKQQESAAIGDILAHCIGILHQAGPDRSRPCSVLTIHPIPFYSRPVPNRPMANSNPCDLFPGALEMMILESLRRQPAHGYAQQISSFDRMFEGIALVLNPGKSPAN